MAALLSDDVCKSPPCNSSPLSIKYSPDGSLITYLFPDASGVRNVFAVDLTAPAGAPLYEPYKLFDASETAAGSGTDSLAEQLRKERMRLFVSGVSSYEWSQTSVPAAPAARRIMLPLHGCVLHYTVPDEKKGTGDGGSGALQVVYDAEANGGIAALDPHLSPDGAAVAFVLDDDLYVLPLGSVDTRPLVGLTGAKEDGSSSSSSGVAGVAGVAGAVPGLVRLTTDGAQDGVSCGVADFIAQEEMDRYRGAPQAGGPAAPRRLRSSSHLIYLPPHLSHLMPHTFCLTPHASHLSPHTSHPTPHLLLLSPPPQASGGPRTASTSRTQRWTSATCRPSPSPTR